MILSWLEKNKFFEDYTRVQLRNSQRSFERSCQVMKGHERSCHIQTDAMQRFINSGAAPGDLDCQLKVFQRVFMKSLYHWLY